jgi:type VI secretion system FHA domain protein
VVSPQSQSLGSKSVKVFQAGGSIGRTAENAWVLPDPDRFVSSQHARVAHEGGRFFLIDESTNGTSVNGRALHKGTRVELRSGDSITIGKYEISVTLAEAQRQPSGGSSSLKDLFPGGDSAPAPEWPEQRPRGGGDSLGGLFGPRSPGAVEDHAPPQQEVFTPPRVSRPPVAPPPPPPPPAPAAGDALPENWWEDPPAPAQPPPAAAFEPPPDEPPPSPTPQARRSPAETMAVPAVTGGPDVSALLEGLGLDPGQVDEAKLAALGQVLRVVVDGVVEVLKARAEVKNQFRVSITTLKPLDNNPLKFSANADDALFNLFGRRGGAFLSPVDAFREAFDDLKSHQIAMLAGMRGAFAELMKQFDPEHLQPSFDRGLKRGALFDVMNKTKYWELYRELYASFGDDDETFKRLFGDEFARAYDEQLRRLTAPPRTR